MHADLTAASQHSEGCAPVGWGGGRRGEERGGGRDAGEEGGRGGRRGKEGGGGEREGKRGEEGGGRKGEGGGECLSAAARGAHSSATTPDTCRRRRPRW